MMNKLKITISAFLTLIAIVSFSQEMTEKEKKSLKKEMMKKAKETDALLLKEMFDNYPSLVEKEKELEKVIKENSNLKNQLDRANAKLNQNARGIENKAKGEAFLAKNGARKEVKTTASGLQYEVINEGTGAKPTASNTVKVHYEGSFIDGKVFDSSIKRGQPIEFGLRQVIKGWTEGLQLMNRGAKFRFYIPYNLAYGERGRPSIPGYSLLIFDVELIDFK